MKKIYDFFILLIIFILTLIALKQFFSIALLDYFLESVFSNELFIIFSITCIVIGIINFLFYLKGHSINLIHKIYFFYYFIMVLPYFILFLILFFSGGYNADHSF